MKKTIIAILMLSFGIANAQDVTNEQLNKAVAHYMDSINKVKASSELTKEKKENWYDKINFRGYVQFRYNGLLNTNEDLSCDQCDKSWGKTPTFFIRRARLIFSGQITPNLYFYFQPDFASSPSTGALNFAQLRDAYFDLSFDPKREYRIRIGQSKVPYSYENLQSSQNRLSLDRNDALNSGVQNERDLGVFFYWAPSEIRERYAMLVRDGYKGSGDYGVFAFGVYNGQGANKPEGNQDLHVVARAAYPFVVGNQIIEPAIQAYTGKWAFSNELSSGIVVENPQSVIDQRIGATFVLFPKPFGIQTEYNFGKGPQYDKTTNTVQVTNLQGGYVLLNYKLDLGKNKYLYPFAKFQYYDGGKKFEKDARSYIVREYELGIEWQPYKFVELTAEYVISDRTYEDSANPDNRQQGNLLRLQAQFSF